MKHAELIDGQIYYRAAPSRKHLDISCELYATIHDYIKRNGGQCKVYHAPFAVLLNDDDSVYIEPRYFGNSVTVTNYQIVAVRVRPIGSLR
ncbi:MAG: hypothetical protein ACLS61_17065 [Ruminococcus sp.]